MKYRPPSQLSASAAILAVVLAAATSATLQSQSTEDQSRWDKAIAQLSSPNRKQRIKGFDAISKMLPESKGDPSDPQDPPFANSLALIDRASADRIKTALIQTLDLEQKLHSRTQSNAGDVDDDYYRSLVFDVAGLNDERALPLLVKELSTGDVVGKAVARFGPKAVEPLIEEGDNVPDDERNRTSCPGELAEMLRTRTVTLDGNPVEYGLVRAAALHWASAPFYEMRDANVLLLEQVNDPATVDALRNLAAADPESEKGPDGAVHYYVRESAQAALDRLGRMAGKGYIDRPI